jgi:hypothetical protein
MNYNSTSMISELCLQVKRQVLQNSYIFSVKRFCVALSSQSWFIFQQKLMESMLKKSTQDANQGSLSFATQEM